MTATLTTPTGQLTAARVLVDLLHRDLPQVSWTVCSICPGDLTGQLGTYTGPLSSRLTALAAYAQLLGAPATLRRYTPRAEVGALHVRGTVSTVRVDVWTGVDAEELTALDGPALAGMLGARGVCGVCRTEMVALSGVLPSRAARCPECAGALPYQGRPT